MGKSPIFLNRAATFELLEKEIERAHRGDGLLAIVLADPRNSICGCLTHRCTPAAATATPRLRSVLPGGI